MPTPKSGRPSRAMRQQAFYRIAGRQRLRPAWQLIPQRRGKRQKRT